MEESEYCPKDCSFLKEKKETKKIPFRCALFNCFLGTDKDQILRCAECLGIGQNVKKEGLNYISSSHDLSMHKQNTKWSFTRLPKSLQSRFVHVAKQQGEMAGIPKGMPLKSLAGAKLMRDGLIQAEIVPENLPKEAQLFSDILKKQQVEFPELLNDKSSKLLTNLFQVLDATEQSLLKGIVENPKKLDSFMQTFNTMPKNENLLKDLRRELDKEMQQEEKRKQEEITQLLLNQKLLKNQNQNTPSL